MSRFDVALRRNLIRACHHSTKRQGSALRGVFIHKGQRQIRQAVTQQCGVPQITTFLCARSAIFMQQPYIFIRHTMIRPQGKQIRIGCVKIFYRR